MKRESKKKTDYQFKDQFNNLTKRAFFLLLHVKNDLEKSLGSKMLVFLISSG